MGSSAGKEHLLDCILPSRMFTIYAWIKDYRQALSSSGSEVQTQVFSIPSVEEKAPQSYGALCVILPQRDNLLGLIGNAQESCLSLLHCWACLPNASRYGAGTGNPPHLAKGKKKRYPMDADTPWYETE